MKELFEKSLPVIDEALRFVFGAVEFRRTGDLGVSVGDVELMLDEHESRPWWVASVATVIPGCRMTPNGDGWPDDVDVTEIAEGYDLRQVLGPFLTAVAEQRYREFYDRKFMGPEEE